MKEAKDKEAAAAKEASESTKKQQEQEKQAAATKEAIDKAVARSNALAARKDAERNSKPN